MAEVKTVNILGATGSVGRSTVDLILSAPERFDVQVLTCNRNVALAAEQAVALRARHVVTADTESYGALRDLLAGTGITVAGGADEVAAAAARPAQWTMAAIVGAAGLLPVMRAVEQGHCVAIANKEPLVAAGAFVMAAAEKAGTTLLPVDSEHNAIFQVFAPEQRNNIENIILTASGGPFRTWTVEQMEAATPEQAVAHPNWSMGAKISVDSATMMNKALEVIEAHYLFGMPPDRIKVMVHPQSVIHSMVSYSDGSVLAQMGAPDMRTPIAHALSWPDRMKTTGQKLDFSNGLRLDLFIPDEEKFPALPLAYRCLEAGPAACIALNAANEVAVAAFLGKKIGFCAIVETIRDIIAAAPPDYALSGIDDVIALDRIVRGLAEDYIAKITTDCKRRSS